MQNLWQRLNSFDTFLYQFLDTGSLDKLSWVSINSKYAQFSSYAPFHVSFTVTLSKKQEELFTVQTI